MFQGMCPFHLGYVMCWCAIVQFYLIILFLYQICRSGTNERTEVDVLVQLTEEVKVTPTSMHCLGGHGSQRVALGSQRKA